MPTKIFVNMPVKDLNKSVEFFTHLGYTFNQQFTDEKATCMIISEDIYAMLLVEPFFQTFTPKKIVNAHESAEMSICLSCDDKAAVDQIIKLAVEAGGSAAGEPQDHGFMYQHGFQDLDGHIWDYVYMDPAFVQPQPEAATAEA